MTRSEQKEKFKEILIILCRINRSCTRERKRSFWKSSKSSGFVKSELTRAQDLFLFGVEVPKMASCFSAVEYKTFEVLTCLYDRKLDDE